MFEYWKHRKLGHIHPLVPQWLDPFAHLFQLVCTKSATLCETWRTSSAGHGVAVILGVPLCSDMGLAPGSLSKCFGIVHTLHFQDAIIDFETIGLLKNKRNCDGSHGSIYREFEQIPPGHPWSTPLPPWLSSHQFAVWGSQCPWTAGALIAEQPSPVSPTDKKH